MAAEKLRNKLQGLDIPLLNEILTKCVSDAVGATCVKHLLAILGSWQQLGFSKTTTGCLQQMLDLSNQGFLKLEDPVTSEALVQACQDRYVRDVPSVQSLSVGGRSVADGLTREKKSFFQGTLRMKGDRQGALKWLFMCLP